MQAQTKTHKNPPDVRAVLAKVRREQRKEQKLGATADQASAPSNKPQDQPIKTFPEAVT